MSENTNKRRKVLKILSGSSVTAFATAATFPQEWSKPIVKTVLLGAHAQVSCADIIVSTDQTALEIRGDFTMREAPVNEVFTISNGGPTPLDASASIEGLNFQPEDGGIFGPLPNPTGTVSISPQNSNIPSSASQQFTVTYQNGCGTNQDNNNEQFSGQASVVLSVPGSSECNTTEIVNLTGGCDFTSQ